jgi:hypothetical protein
VLIATPCILAEVVRNLPDFPLAATTEWLRLRGQLLIMDDVLMLDRPAVFPAGKDRPILFGAVAWAGCLAHSGSRRFRDSVEWQTLRSLGT